MCLQLLRSTVNSATSSPLLDSRGIDYAVVLTADHGGRGRSRSGSGCTGILTRPESIPH